MCLGQCMGGEGKAGDSDGSIAEVMGAEAAASEGWTHTECPVVLYKHIKSVCLSLPFSPPSSPPVLLSLKMKYSNITEKR